MNRTQPIIVMKRLWTKVLAIVIFLLIVFNCYLECIAFHFFSNDDGGRISVLCFNVHGSGLDFKVNSSDFLNVILEQVLEPDTVIYKTKDGPYASLADEDMMKI